MGSGFAKALEASWYEPLGWNRLLLPLEWLFAVLAALRRRVFARGLRSRYRAACPVLVVGNIHVGGTGKTPVVIELVNRLRGRGLDVVVLSRGYGARSAPGVSYVTPDSDPTELGDETVMIARATEVPVAVSCKRADAAARVCRDLEPQLIVCDDGLQHYALHRDMEIVTMDAARGFGNGHLLPVGPLREPPARLATVDWLLERGGSDPDTAFHLEPVMFMTLDGNRRLMPADAGALGKVHAVAGIGNPGQFFQMLRNLGLEVVEHRFADHHRFQAEDLEPLADLPVIMTEKDAVKCRGFAADNHWLLRVGAQLPNGLVDWVQGQVRQWSPV